MTPYRLLGAALLPLLPVHLLWRGLRDRRYLQGIPARFGYGDAPSAVGGIWLHAVSVGEVNVAVPLLQWLSLQYPDHPLYLTTTTPSGAARAASLPVANVWHTYLPYDYPSAARRFLNRLQPALGVIMETELWPHLLAECHARQLPLIFANARLSARALRRYQRARWLARMPWEAFAHIAAQSEADAKRLQQLGAPPEVLTVSGNLKYERRLEASARAAGQAWRRKAGKRPVWVAGSTHAGEETQLLKVFAALRKQFPDLQLVLAPRHPERARAVMRQARAAGWRAGCHSDPAQTPLPEVYVLDSIGLLGGFLAVAEAAFIGGSLVQHGGHNLLEACEAGVPVAFGPFMHNFADIAAQVQACGAGAQAEAGQLAAQLAVWLGNPQARAEAGRQGQALIARQRGALRHYQAVFTQWMPG